ncbi:MerR family transcriptional regulator [Actinocorallia sp. A-T 12471]|uniref:DNA polymerase III subunit beta family protein n=1 Tax=Actinocorallia sp. A-T 12471 TaxID=3089813 RepID=UPI0029CDFE95|nr:MerR family transcriptional regulator [Actinocorallia sp. A-T 12471]MDX6743913.1 MerR family transcriptional regulator [Actinocorallia sp. A-T 12471]
MQHTELMSIGAFARAVGLTPSALRFYDDCAVLTPAHVDPDTGYRYYSTHQTQRANTLRRLREADIPLTDATTILDGPQDHAHTLLQTHARRTEAAAQATRDALDDLLRTYSPGHRVRLDGAALTSALRQVAPAADSDHPVLSGILLDIDRAEIRLVATDRYRMSVRALPAQPHGTPHRLLADPDALTNAAAWALHHPHVDLETDTEGTRLRHGDHTHPLPTLPGDYPDYQTILDLPEPRHRILTDRATLRDALTHTPGPVTLHTTPHQLTVTYPDAPAHTQPATCTGPPITVAFNPHVLLPALDTGLGPDTLLELTAPDQPVTIRSADQGTFTTLAMPTLETP